MVALDVIIDVLAIAGSLGIFLFGMKLMSESLLRVAGNRMRSILSSITANRFKGLLTGLFLTSTVQSSSAVTVMLVSFVNAGLLSLYESIGVIMGANIGTTLTSWLVSILGYDFNLEHLLLPLIGLSLPLYFSKNKHHKSWGEFIIGFSILFMGLGFLKESLPVLDEESTIIQNLTMFSGFGLGSVLIFILAGAVLTVLFQSSSATIALTIVMAANGWISFEMAAAMVLGENIGTTVTAIIAALMANREARRAALSHLIFNVMGVVLVLIVFSPFVQLVKQVTVFVEGTSPETSHLAIPVGISVFHTLFNVLNTLVLVGFIGFIVQIVRYFIPVRDEEKDTFRLKYINSSLMSTSELALFQVNKELVVYVQRVWQMFEFIPSLLLEKRPKKYTKLLTRVQKYENIVDRMEIEIGSYLTSISESDLSRSGSQKIRYMLRIIDEIENIGDVCHQMAILIDEKNQNKVWFNQEMRNNLSAMHHLIDEAFSLLIDDLREGKSRHFEAAGKLEDKINIFRDELRKKNREDIRDEKYTYRNGRYYSDLVSLSEKIGDHILQIHKSLPQENRKVKAGKDGQDPEN